MKERRINVCPFRDLSSLKRAYSEYLSSEEIDKIIAEVIKSGRFKERTENYGITNNDCLINLIDIELCKIINKIKKTSKIRK